MVTDWQEVLRGRKVGSGGCGDYICGLIGMGGRAGRGEAVSGSRARGSSNVAA